MRSATDNSAFAATDVIFRKACELAGVKITKRQASRYRNGFGSAFKMRSEAHEEVYKDRLTPSVEKAG